MTPAGVFAETPAVHPQFPEAGRLINALSALMNTTAHIVNGVRPEAAELLRLVAPLPAAERRGVVEILEREVAARLASVDAGDGVVGPLDRRSQLFVRVFAPTLHDTPAATPDEVLASCLHGLLRLADLPAHLDDTILAGVVEAAATVSALEHAAFANMLRTLIHVLEQALAQGPA